LGDYSGLNIPAREYIYMGDIPVGVLTTNEVVMDNSGTGTTVVGTWATVTDGSSGTAIGTNYRTHAAGTGSSSFTWTPGGLGSTAQSTRIYARWVAGSDRATNATYQVAYSGGTTNVSVDQTQHGSEWVLLGTFNLVNGNNVALTDNANGLVVADA